MKPPVKMHILSTCSRCISIKKLLNDCAVEDEFMDLDLLTGDGKMAIIAVVR
jgi:hypothetical protein